MALKIVRLEYYWPTLNIEVEDFVQKYDKCQRQANTIHQPPKLLTPISSFWSFAQLRVNLIGPLPKGKGQTKFAVVVVDYSTK